MTLIGIALVPMYIEYMGAEVYGLVALYATMQASFNILDLGLSPTISRETARFYSGAISRLEFRQVFRFINLIFCLISLVSGGLLFNSSYFVVERWLHIGNLSPIEVQVSIQIMAICVSLRLLSGLYRGVIVGAEKIVLLSGFSIVVATLRFIGVFVSMHIWGYTPQVFFYHQLFAAIFEICGYAAVCNDLLPNVRDIGQRIGWAFKPIKPVLKFALTIAFTSSVWVVVTQTDKLVLSGILDLAEYGYFSLAVLSAGSIMVITGPISTALMPRMAAIYAEGNSTELIEVYRYATRIVSIFAGTSAATLTICAEPILFAWSGNLELSNATAPIMRLYAIGNGFLAISAFPYYLQYAKGNLRYHLIGNVIMVLLLVPCFVYASIRFGAIGAGTVWIAINGLYLLTWVAYIHKKLEPGLHSSWLMRDVLLILLPIAVVAVIIRLIDVKMQTRIEMFIYTLVVGIGLLSISVFVNTSFKGIFLKATNTNLV